MALSSGTKLGPYEIQSLLGAGGMGEVYRARDTRLGRDVAIKILPPHLSSNPDLRERFEREARAISSLNHPRICTLHDIGHQDGISFLVMEYLEGESLAERLKKGQLSLKEALKVGMEVSEALEVAHRAAITHRDLKPGNIMLTKSGAKLMDFGLAKAAVVGAEAASVNAPLLSAAKTLSGPSPLSPLTTAGQVIGTIQYMSPEQIEGKPADARSDLFALGAVLYEMATGKRPFEGKSQISVASAILEKDPPPISTIEPLTPTAFEHVVSACLAKDPDDRIQTAHDVRLGLKLAAAEATSHAAATAIVPKSGLALTVLPWVIAVIILAAIGTFFLINRDTPQVQYTNVTYRQGILQAARFSQDEQTIVYSGEWEGKPPQIAVSRMGSPESRLLGLPSATIAAISSSDELAVLEGCEFVFLVDCGGTLATVSLSGGSPRAIAEHVAFADWSPDGKQLAISVFSAEGTRLESPPGHLLYQQKAGWFSHPKFSPDGSMIAFGNHPIVNYDDGAIEIVDLTGKRTILSKGWISLEGLDWSPNGKEIWFAGARLSEHSGWAGAIHAVSMSGKERTLLLLPSVRLHDVTQNGRVLLSHESWRRQLVGRFPDDNDEHPYSWLDNTAPTAISADGRSISFFEAGEVYYIEGDRLAYYRRTDGSPAVRLGRGAATISPDGKSVLVDGRDSKLVLQPIGPGEAKQLPTPGLVAFEHSVWSDDGRTIAYEAQTTQNGWNVYTQRVEGGTPVLVKTGGRFATPTLSPDGRTLALREEQGGISLYHADGSAHVSVKGALTSEFPVRFANGGKSLLVADPTGRELVVTLIDLVSGRRELWKRFNTDVRESTIVVTPDLKYYAYSKPNYSSDLYILSGLR
jgi:eukaryotic-like serine/threonine-protein kinase